jgi:hypothetical protein
MGNNKGRDIHRRAYRGKDDRGGIIERNKREKDKKEG